jgi:hypothetical protein
VSNCLLVLGAIFWLSAGGVCVLIAIIKFNEAREWREQERLREQRRRRPF